MLEITKNIFLHHIADIREDICGETKEIQAPKEDMIPDSHILDI